MLDPKKANYWLPVDQYIGGIEHAVMHLLYARFFHKLMRDEGLVSSSEPFKKLLCQGMVLADAYYKLDENNTRCWLHPTQVNIEKNSDGNIRNISEKNTGAEVFHAGMIKMSKSKNNGIDPHDIIEKYGTDAARLYCMFAAPPDQALEWSDSAVEGASRFLKRVWRVNYNYLKENNVTGAIKINFDNINENAKKLYKKTHQTIQKVTDDIDRRQMFNTAIAAIMELVNSVYRFCDQTDADKKIKGYALQVINRLLAPITPHICHYIWQAHGFKQPVIDEPWPEIDTGALIVDTVVVIVQVNGKVRGKMVISSSISEAKLKELALNHENVQKFINNKTLHKTVIIPNKLINFVVS